MPRQLIGAVVNLGVILLCVALCQPSAAQLVPYDSFNSHNIREMTSPLSPAERSRRFRPPQK